MQEDDDKIMSLYPTAASPAPPAIVRTNGARHERNPYISKRDLVERLISRLEADFSIAPPRMGDNDGHAVSHWLDRYRDRFVEILTELLPTRETMSIEERVKRAEKVLPDVEPELRAFALGRAALRWGAGHYPNFVEFGVPVALFNEPFWEVPLEHTRTHRVVGQVIIDAEGNVSLERTTTSQQVREALTVAA